MINDQFCSNYLILHCQWNKLFSLTLFRSGGYQIHTCLPFSLYLRHGFCSESKQTYRNRVKRDFLMHRHFCLQKIEMFQRERMLNHEKIIKNIYLYENLRFKVWFFLSINESFTYPPNINVIISNAKEIWFWSSYLPTYLHNVMKYPGFLLDGVP